MACKTEEKIINESEYVCTQYPASESYLFKLELISVFGSSLPKLVSALKEESSQEQQMEAISSAIKLLFESASPKKIIDLMISMMTSGHLKVDGKRMTKSLFDQHYSGDNMSEGYKAFLFVIRTNYQGFFKGQKGGDFLTKAEENL